jgi:hypothetical protein
MALSTSTLYTLFRDKAGENDRNPLDPTILKYLNLARNSAEAVLLDLYPMLSNEMSTLVTPVTIDLTANTTNYTMSAIPDVIEAVFAKFNAAQDYRKVENVVQGHIDDEDLEALRATEAYPVVGISNGKLDIYPKPRVAVTSGVRIDCLQLPADMSDGDSLVESDKIGMLEVDKAIPLYYRAQKMYKEADYFEGIYERNLARILLKAPGKRPEKRIPRGQNNLSRYW